MRFCSAMAFWSLERSGRMEGEEDVAEESAVTEAATWVSSGNRVNGAGVAATR